MEKKEIKSIGPVEDRLKKVWNRAKHFDEDILEADSIDTITAPVWLTADGICSQDGKAPGVVVSVAWNELHTLLLQYQEDLKYFCETRINEFVASQASSGQPQE